MIRVERHELGPRCFVLGRRVHEWHAGLALLAAAGVVVAAGIGFVPGVLGAVGAWLFVKDWNDLVPSRRDTTAWSLGVHRRPLALRDRPWAAWLPRLAGWLTAALGAVNVISALTPELPGRLSLLAHLAPGGLILTAHALVLPAGLALLVLSVYLGRRRRRALWLAVGLLGMLGGFELLKGLDVEEALAGWALAGLLVWGRDAFSVRHDDRSLSTALRRAGLAVAVAVGATALGVLAAAAWSTPALTAGLALRETLALLTLSPGPLHLGAAFAWLPLGVGLLAGSALLAVAWALFRPLSAPRTPPTPVARALARRLVRQHGRDTLSAFKLREDLQTLISQDARAFLSYRVESGVLLVSGDPVGPEDALPALVRELRDFAATRGLRVGAVGASEEFTALGRDAGLRSLYLGDEAIVPTAGFSLEGKPIKKVRQAVNRLAREGYGAEACVLGQLGAAELVELEDVSDRWRAGVRERGFSMAMEGLRGEHLADSIVIVARDADGAVRGFLHFVPAYGRPAMSLSAMRRDRDTPNGLNQFLVVRAIELLGERGTQELSLNFAAFARWLHSPRGRGERVLARLVRRANPYFQIESLYAFNAKFAPRWQPRYLLHEGIAALPRTALAAMWAEGQLPRPALRKRDPNLRRGLANLSAAKLSA
ncbi:MAG: phosphatidylglycerol lysyltransferase domain-containing protein [Solirubrobacteraceae bacterium]